MAEKASLKGYEPNILDDFHNSETNEIFFHRQSTRNRRTRAMRNSTMNLSEKRFLHHCSFRSEKTQRTEDKLITLMKKGCCQLSSFSHTHTIQRHGALVLHSRVQATLVVEEVPSTCRIPTHVEDMTGKRGASQGSPLRVAPGVPLGMGGDPEPCTERLVNITSLWGSTRASRTPCRCRAPLALMEGRDVSSCSCRSGHSTTFPCPLFTESTGLVVPTKPPHCSPCWLRLLRLRRLFIEKSLMEKKNF